MEETTNSPFDTLRGPLSLYLHVPFCRSRCHYCSFYSLVPKEGDMDRWLRGVLLEWDQLRQRMDKATLRSLYVGGGTPSVVPLAAWRVLLEALALVPWDEAVEFTVEANPESLTAELLELWAAGGVNRVSLGLQSLDDGELRRLGRRHDSRQALKALELCQGRGFRVSGDLIFGLPGQGLRQWHKSLSVLVRQGLDHISLYQLTLEPGSLWHRRPPADLPEGYGMYRWAQYYLPKKGLDQYEIASFARPGQESRHNSVYWTRENVVALGPAAWGFVEGCRYSNSPSLDDWLRRLDGGASPVTFQERRTGGDAASEAAVLALRTRRGLVFSEFRDRYGQIYLEELQRRVAQLPRDCFRFGQDGLSLSAKGMRLGNAIWSELLELDRTFFAEAGARGLEAADSL